jgi:uncharacterized protein (UPF0371 family)
VRIGFDNDQYIRMQAERIRRRIDQFGGKLYLEFGGKLFDDYHASRVLPGFAPDSKARMLRSLADDAEAVMTIARHEGLWAHAESVALRVEALDALA